MSEQPDDVARLRAEVERLSHELDAVRSAPPSASPAVTHGRTGAWRTVLVVVLLILVGILSPLVVVASWVHDEISDTDRYVATVAPLADNPAIQNAVANEITTQVFDRLDVQAVTQRAIAALSEKGLRPSAVASLTALAGPLANSIKSFIHTQVLELVQSDEFATAWAEANRTAHQQMVALLTGNTDNGAVSVSGGTVSINLATVINSVKARLQDRGFTLAANIPSVNAQFTLFQSKDLTKAQSAFHLLTLAARVLLVIDLVLLGIAIFVARSRRNAVIAGSLVVVVSMILLGFTLNAFRVVYLDAVPSTQLPPDAAAAVYDQLVHFIRLALRSVLVLFLIIAAVAWVTGPSATAASVRAGTERLVGYLRSSRERAGLNTGRYGVAIWEHRTPIRIGVLALAFLLYVLASHPTARYTLTLLIVAVLVLLVLGILARPPESEEPESQEPSETGGHS